MTYFYPNALITILNATPKKDESVPKSPTNKSHNAQNRIILNDVRVVGTIETLKGNSLSTQNPVTQTVSTNASIKPTSKPIGMPTGVDETRNQETKNLKSTESATGSSLTSTTVTSSSKATEATTLANDTAIITS